MHIHGHGVIAGLDQAAGYLLSQDAIDEAADGRREVEIAIYRYANIIVERIKAEIERRKKEDNDG